MSLIISNIALHFISKKEESGEVSLRFGPENIEKSTKITVAAFLLCLLKEIAMIVQKTVKIAL